MVRLVREASDTPNITNKDDTRMIRYAYGGYDGAIKDYGNELMYSKDATNSVFSIGSGRFVLQGWEVDLDEAGWSINFKGVSGTRYYNIYLEINLASETASIIAVYGTSSYPSTSLGDNLTTVSSGTARFILYRIAVSNGTISQVTKEFSTIEYDKDISKGMIENYIDPLNKDLQATKQTYAMLAGPKHTGQEGANINFNYGTLLIAMIPEEYTGHMPSSGGTVGFGIGTVIDSPGVFVTSEGSRETVAFYVDDANAGSLRVLPHPLSLSYDYLHVVNGSWFVCGAMPDRRLLLQRIRL